MSDSINVDTGVSNGDVDWLFRGKSKKLVKKKTDPNIRDQSGTNVSASPREEASKKDEVPTIPKTTHSNLAAAVSSEPPKPISSSQSTPTTASPKNVTGVSDSVKTSAAANSSTSNPVLPSAEPDPILNQIMSQQESKKSNLTSQMERLKIGRVRSLSASSDNKPLLSPISSSKIKSRSSSDSTKNGKHIHNTEASSSPVTISKSNSPLQDSSILSRSNSGSKRSIFSSISSKFKSSSRNASPVSSSSPSNVLSDQTSISSPHSPKSVISIPIKHNRKSSISSLGSSSPKSIKLNQVQEPAHTVSKEQNAQSVLLTGNLANSRSLLQKDQHTTQTPKDRIILNKNPNRVSVPLKELTNVRLRRVTFAVDKLVNDPQQQIPSRRPKKGNVIIPEDLIAAPPRLSLGISSATADNQTKEAPKVNEKELQLAVEAQKKAMIEADKHAQEAHLAARRIALEVSQYKFKNSNSLTTSVSARDDDVEDENDGELHNVDRIEIDKPLHIHEYHFDDGPSVTDDSSSDNESIKELSLELIYTRCCHLREILPIPATLKQLKNKTKPLQVLKLLNPRPTLIDVLSFSDFIAIVPIITIIFDNVTMTTEMLRAFLSSLVNNKSLEKLSLRNVAIDADGWKYLCKFLSKNKSIKKLDISQQRVKSDTPQSSIRSSMNWQLFIDSLVLRGGIEELVINGCKLTDSIFDFLVENAVKISTQRLGIASTDLNVRKAKIVSKWISNPDSKCVGVDIAFNDMSQGQLAPFIKTFNEKSQLVFFSLNSTNLSDTKETVSLIKALSKIPTLRFLDFSSIPKVFPGIISCLNKYLPKFQNLRRIHFDLNELSSDSISAIAGILPKCDNLIHVSLLGNKNVTQSSAAALYAAVKASNSIYTLDLDFDLVSDELSKRIAFYLMRNMERTMNSEIMFDHSNDNPEDLMFDGSLLMEAAEKLLETNNKDNDEKQLDLKTQKIVTDALVKRTRSVRQEIHKTIDSLFEMRDSGGLNLEMKEMLLRFCLLDSSLEKLANIFEETASASNDKNSNAHPQVNGVNSKISDIDYRVDNGNASNDHDHLHESSTGLITSGPILSPHGFEESNMNSYFPSVEQPAFQPHQVVIDSSSDGTSVPIDNSTGRPVLIRSISQTSEHAKRQEEEEGEFHRWGFFVQQQKSIFPYDRTANISSPTTATTLTTQSASSSKSPTTQTTTPLLNVLPSGSELREAIIKAKGIQSVTDLIDKINHNRVSIDNIYNYNVIPTSSGSTTMTNNVPANNSDTSAEPQIGSPISNSFNLASSPPLSEAAKSKRSMSNHDSDDVVSVKSIDSLDDVNADNRFHAVVDEVYDKLLNDAKRVRSNK